MADFSFSCPQSGAGVPGRRAATSGAVSYTHLDVYKRQALDVYRKIPYPEREKNEQNAWLSLLTTENLSDAEELVRDYPWLEEIYQEIAMLRRKPEEVLGLSLIHIFVPCGASPVPRSSGPALTQPKFTYRK